MPGTKKLDAIDVRILRELRKNASLTATELTGIVHLSIPAINKRIANMISSGLIERYTIMVNPEAAGKSVLAFVSVVLKSPDYIEEFLATVRREDNITGCYAVVGEYDYILHMYASSILMLNEQILMVKRIPGVTATHTTVALETYKREFSVIPDVEKEESDL